MGIRWVSWDWERSRWAAGCGSLPLGEKSIQEWEGPIRVKGLSMQSNVMTNRAGQGEDTNEGNTPVAIPVLFTAHAIVRNRR
jgi:hypothetical protein